MKLFRSTVFVFVYVITLLAMYCIHAQYFFVNVVFYSAIFDALLAAILLLPILTATRYFDVLGSLEKGQIFVICILSGYIFAISVPTVIDRSLSFYILEKLEQRGGGIRQDRFAEVFSREYMEEYRLVDVRLTEQAESGTIKIENGCVKLTPRGQKLAAISGYFRQHFLPKHRLLMGSYTDDLVDPLRRSGAGGDYRCH
jgi:hypothetical protein